jgi:hypothetical protein
MPSRIFEGVQYAIGEGDGAELRLGSYMRVHPIVMAEKRVVWIRVTLHGPAGPMPWGLGV